LNLWIKKVHLTKEGLQQIINLKSSMNLGLSDVLKTNFIKTISIVRPIFFTKNIPDPNWLAGFVSGEGNFDITIHLSKRNKIGYQVQLRFRIGQHERELKLMKLLIKYLGSGSIYKNTNTLVVSLTISKFLIINKTIIPIFKENPIHGVKYLDFIDFCKVANLMKEGKHLTIEGLELIRSIKLWINKGRK